MKEIKHVGKEFDGWDGYRYRVVYSNTYGQYMLLNLKTNEVEDDFDNEQEFLKYIEDLREDC